MRQLAAGRAWSPPPPPLRGYRHRHLRGVRAHASAAGHPSQLLTAPFQHTVPRVPSRSRRPRGRPRLVADDAGGNPRSPWIQPRPPCLSVVTGRKTRDWTCLPCRPSASSVTRTTCCASSRATFLTSRGSATSASGTRAAQQGTGRRARSHPTEGWRVFSRELAQPGSTDLGRSAPSSRHERTGRHHRHRSHTMAHALRHQPGARSDGSSRGEFWSPSRATSWCPFPCGSRCTALWTLWLPTTAGCSGPP